MMLVIADIAALLAAFVLSLVVAGVPESQGTDLSYIFLATLPVWILGIKTAGLYDHDKRLINHSTLDEIVDLARIAALCTSLVLALTWALAPQSARIGQLVLLWIAATVGLMTFRVAVRAVLHRDPRLRQKTLILGAGSVGQSLGMRILHHPEYRLNLVGFVDATPKEQRADLKTLTIVGTPDDLPRLVRELGIDRVIVAFSNDSSESMTETIRLLRDVQTNIDIVPRLFDVIPPGVTSQSIEGIPLISLPPLRLSIWAKCLKRSLDLLVAIGLVVVLAPLLLLIAVISKLSSPGPVLFRQVRMGANEKPFRILKFRTMALDADERKADVAHLNKYLEGGDPRMFKVVADPRVTAFGRFLRKYSLDELPQLFNVLRGDMSLVGPRPLIIEEDHHIEAWGRRRLALKPGITGLWQVLGRNEIPFDEMVKLDYLYVTSWSLSRDLRILLRTLPIVLRGDAP